MYFITDENFGGVVSDIGQHGCSLVSKEDVNTRGCKIWRDSGFKWIENGMHLFHQIGGHN